MTKPVGLLALALLASIGMVGTPDTAQAQTPVTVAAAVHPGIAAKVSASHLLNLLKVKEKEKTHAGSYARSKFKQWIDADHDGENTRAEVLKAESLKPVTENSHHTVETGEWASKYTGTVYTKASALDIDHLVPLQEAWTSGASSWSAAKRTAYANDLGYGADLIAVSLHQNRSKGDKAPDKYLPPKKSYDCAYVRNWIAVKYRWKLTVDPSEKTVLRADLRTDCSTVLVARPGKPNIAKLIGTASTPIAPTPIPAPVPTPPPPTVPAPPAPTPTSPLVPAPDPTPTAEPAPPAAPPSNDQGIVHPGAFCSPAGATGRTAAGTPMICTSTATDSRDRWRAAGA